LCGLPPKGADEHGKAINPGPEYGNCANATRAATSQTLLTELVTNALYDVPGEAVFGVAVARRDAGSLAAAELSVAALDPAAARIAAWCIAKG
jgi:hypothetical protein